jgi:excisionase family DNA binding protein
MTTDSPGDSYSTSEAAKVLRVTPGRVRQMISEGLLSAEHDADGRWRIDARSVHARMPERPPREAAPPPAPEDLQRRLVELAERVGRAEARAELTERAESTVREALERERERADRLEEELRQERSKGFWQRLFGR